MPTVECPHCDEEFFVVYPDEDEVKESEENESRVLTTNLLSWERVEARHPYPAASTWSDERIQENIQRVRTSIEINGTPIRFEFFQKPASMSHFWTHVVRGMTDEGRKSKNIVVTDEGELYVKNRGVPWDEDKQWTYLSKEELARRSEIAGLGDVIEVPETEGGLGLLLDEKDRPLIIDGEIQGELVVKMAKALLVMQSTQNPA